MSNNPFLGKASEYQEYEKTPRSLFRSMQLQFQMESFIEKNSVKRILDVGCGTGTLALSLAGKGFNVTAIDPDQGMIDVAKKEAVTTNATINLLTGGVKDLDELIEGSTFDLVICHSVLEFLSNSTEVIQSLKRFIAPKGFLSIETKNVAAPVFYNVFVKQDFGKAKEELFNRVQKSQLIGSDMQAFSVGNLEEILINTGFSIAETFGVRIFPDYLPEKILESEKTFSDLLELEKILHNKPPYNAVGRYIHLIGKL